MTYQASTTWFDFPLPTRTQLKDEVARSGQLQEKEEELTEYSGDPAEKVEEDVQHQGTPAACFQNHC